MAKSHSRLTPERIVGWVEDGSGPFVTQDREATIENIARPARIRINNRVGEVHVVAGDSRDLRIEATITVWESGRISAEEALDRVTFAVHEEDDGRVIVECGAERGIDWQKTPKVDLTVYVPQPSEITIKEGVGEVTVVDIEGTLDVKTDVGRIGVEGLIMTGDCTLRTDVGEVAVTLPRDAQFTLDASSDVGDVACAFDLDNARTERRGAMSAVRGVAGDEPVGTLTVRVRVGAVRVERD